MKPNLSRVDWALAFSLENAHLSTPWFTLFHPGSHVDPTMDPTFGIALQTVWNKRASHTTCTHSSFGDISLNGAACHHLRHKSFNSLSQLPAQAVDIELVVYFAAHGL